MHEQDGLMQPYLLHRVNWEHRELSRQREDLQALKTHKLHQLRHDGNDDFGNHHQARSFLQP